MELWKKRREGELQRVELNYLHTDKVWGENKEGGGTKTIFLDNVGTLENWFTLTDKHGSQSVGQTLQRLYSSSIIPRLFRK